MNFSPYQYRKVEQQFLQQFELRSFEYYDQNIDNQSLIDYKKLINLMQTNRNQTLKKRQRLQLIKEKNLAASFDIIISEQKQQEKNQDQKQEENNFANGFYITENIPEFKKRTLQSQRNKETTASRAKSINSRLRQSTVNIQSRIIGSETNENLNLESIQDRIYTQYNVLESLSHEESQVQEAIFCFKRRISDLQQQLSAQNMKQKQVERIYVQNNNDMMHVKYTNQQVKAIFSKTKKHFNLDLQGRKQIQQKCSQTNKNNFQQSIINHIYLQKMKQKISEQQKQLAELRYKKYQLDSKQKKYQSIYQKEQEFLKTYESIIKINPNNTQKDKTVSISIQEPQKSDETQTPKKSLKSLKSTKKFNLKTKNSFNLLNQSQNKGEALIKIVSSLINLYKQLKDESIKKTSEFKILISERDQKQKQLTRILQKINTAYDFEGQQSQPKTIQDRSQLNKSIKKTKQIQEKCSLLNTITINIEQRIAFCLSRHLSLMETILKSFLRHDKNSIKFFKNLMKQTLEVPRLFKFLKNQIPQETFQWQERELHIQQSRNLLIQNFENWQNYLQYLNIIHESKYIQSFITQKKLIKLFKIIIKTKLKNKTLPTHDIFQKAVKKMFDQSTEHHLSQIKKTLSIFKELNLYIQKVKNGSIKIHCTINYDSFQTIAEHNLKQEISKNPSQKQLIRSDNNNKSKSSTKQKNTPYFLNPLKTQKGFLKQKQLLHTFSSTQKNLQSSNQSEISLMSRLKKRKNLSSVLNLNQFYEQMREQIQKVQKMSIQ